MTKQEKIDILWKMMWLNFKYKFGRKNTIALCYCFEMATNFKKRRLRENIPEILKHKNVNFINDTYWWSFKGRFLPWWERHLAIWRTIQDIKK